MRLGVYSDLVYRSDGTTVSTHQAFIRFVTSLPPRVEEIVLFGRLDPQLGRSHYALPSEGVRLVPLPHYSAVTDLVGQSRALRGSARVFAAELPKLDAVWVFGPHPMAVVLALVARRRGIPLFLGVRQDYPEYIRNRLPGRAWAWALPVARGLDRAFRALARRAPTVALGAELEQKYREAGASVLTTGFSLVRETELVPLEEAIATSWDDELVLLSVGRLAAEKNALLLPEILARLRDLNSGWRLVVAGEGPLGPAVARRAEELGVAGAFEFRGYVRSGPELWRLYRESNAFLHVSLTEGLPQVLWEAQAAGLPVVATDVGGVRGAVGDTSLLIPPADADAAVEALERLREDRVLREGMIARGLANAANETMEAQLDRIAAFFRSDLEHRGS